jgi:hypothetical protein
MQSVFIKRRFIDIYCQLNALTWNRSAIYNVAKHGCGMRRRKALEGDWKAF